MADEIAELRQTLPAVTTNSEGADRVLGLFGIGLDRVEQILRDPSYEAGKDVKRDRLMFDITATFSSQLMRLGEIKLRTQNTDKIGELLLLLQQANEGDPKER